MTGDPSRTPDPCEVCRAKRNRISPCGGSIIILLPVFGITTNWYFAKYRERNRLKNQISNLRLSALGHFGVQGHNRPSPGIYKLSKLISY